MIVSIALNILNELHLFAFDRTHTIYGLLHPAGLRCPAVIDRGCSIISGFRRHLGPTDTLGLGGLDVMLVSIRCLTSPVPELSFLPAP